MCSLKPACSGTDRYTSPNPLSPLTESSFSPIDTHSLLRDWNVIWLAECAVRGPLGGERGAMKGWVGETILQPLLRAETVTVLYSDRSVQSPQCCLLSQLLCETGSTPAHFPSQQSLSPPLMPCAHCSQTVSSFLTLFPSFILSAELIFTHWALWQMNASPLSFYKYPK